MTDHDEFLTTAQVAELLGVQPAAVIRKDRTMIHTITARPTTESIARKLTVAENVLRQYAGIWYVRVIDSRTSDELLVIERCTSNRNRYTITKDARPL